MLHNAIRRAKADVALVILVTLVIAPLPSVKVRATEARRKVMPGIERR